MNLTSSDLAELDELFPLDAAEGAEGGGAAEAPVVAPPVILDPSNAVLRTKGTLKRRSAPIIGYCGLNGHGKTFAMVRDSLLGLALGYNVLSTVNILDPESGNSHPRFELFRSWQQLQGGRNTEILLDEVTGVMDARDSGMPKYVRRMLPQQRRENNRVSWTGIDWDNSDRRLRQLTWAMVRCRGHFPKRPEVRSDGFVDAVPMWAPNRLFVLTTFDAQRMTQSDDSAQITEDKDRKRRARVLNREFVRGPGSVAFSCYNTLDSVSQVDGSCPVCQGRIPEKVCRGH